MTSKFSYKFKKFYLPMDIKCQLPKLGDGWCLNFYCNIFT